ncbi:MAG: PAS domain S-box protein [Magnetococcus sp. YQC-5]
MGFNPGQWKSFYAVFAGVITTFAFMGLLWTMDQLQAQKHHIQNRAEVQNVLSVVRANLESALNHRLHLIRGLTAFVTANPNFSSTEFHAFVSELGANLKGVRSLQLAPNAVVTHIHPEKGNEAAKGHDLLQDPQRRHAVLRAIEKKQFIIAGPVELLQGGKALIGRTPIFLTTPVQPDQPAYFWGLAIILLDFEPILQESGLLSHDLQFDFALRGKDGLGASGDPFFGNPRIFQADPVLQNVTLPNGSWQIAALPRQGWHATWSGRELFYLMGLFSSILVGWLLFFLIRRPSQLQETIDQGAAQLRTLSTAIRAVATGIVITNRNGIIEWVNPAFSEETGYAPEEIIGHTPALLKSGLQPDAFYQTLWSTIQAGQTWRGEFTNRHKEGRLYIDETIITPVMDKNNQIERFIAIKQDITRRRQKEIALRASHLRFRSLIQTAKDAIIIANREGQIETWNRGARDIFGYEEEEVLHRTIEFLMPEHYQEAHRIGLGRMQWQGELHLQSQIKELTGLRKNGEEFALELSLSHWKMEDQWFHLAIIRDLTPRKAIEKKLIEYNEKLEIMVQERTRQLLHTERLATLGTFSAGIAHEIKNPNAFISGNVAFLQQFWTLAAPMLETAVQNQPKSQVARFLKEIRPALEGIDKGSQRINTIIDSLKSYATGNRGTQKTITPLIIPLEEARTLLQHRFKHGTRLILSVPDHLTLSCNVQEISQVFINLFNNAMDAMDEQGLEQNRTIQVNAEQHDTQLRVLIQDNGPGIPKSVREEIFQPFFTTKGPTRGTGLGLSIVKGIIENHQGQITILDHEPPGATFELVFPGGRLKERL